MKYSFGQNINATKGTSCEINTRRKIQYVKSIVQIRAILCHLLKYIGWLKGTECTLAIRWRTLQILYLVENN